VRGEASGSCWFQAFAGIGVMTAIAALQQTVSRSLGYASESGAGLKAAFAGKGVP